MPTFTDETLRKSFQDWETAGESRACMKEVADWWLSEFHDYQTYLISQGECKKEKLQDTGGMTGHYIAGQKKAIEEYQKVIRGE